jgi:hypothetical protein
MIRERADLRRTMSTRRKERARCSLVMRTVNIRNGPSRTSRPRTYREPCLGVLSVSTGRVQRANRTKVRGPRQRISKLRDREQSCDGNDQEFRLHRIAKDKMHQASEHEQERDQPWTPYKGGAQGVPYGTELSQTTSTITTAYALTSSPRVSRIS